MHCHTTFESTYKGRIYCGHSCSTLAYYARKKAATVAGPPATPPPAAATPAAEAVEPTQVTLAFNAQNLAMLTAGPLLSEGVQKALEYLRQQLAPLPPAGPSTWLPAVFQLLKQPLVPYQHADWEEPRFFVPVPWQDEVFFYRAAQDLLFWQAPNGVVHQLTQEDEFTQLLEKLSHQKQQLQQLVQQYVPQVDYRALRLPLGPPKTIG